MSRLDPCPISLSCTQPHNLALHSFLQTQSRISLRWTPVPHSPALPTTPVPRAPQPTASGAPPSTAVSPAHSMMSPSTLASAWAGPRPVTSSSAKRGPTAAPVSSCPSAAGATTPRTQDWGSAVWAGLGAHRTPPPVGAWTHSVLRGSGSSTSVQVGINWIL